MIDAHDQEILLDHDKIAREKKIVEDQYAERQKFLEDWRNGVLNSPEGRRIVWDLLGLLGYQKKMFSSDPLIMAKNCGIHDDALLVVIKDIEEAQPGILFKMQNELRRTQASKDK